MASDRGELGKTKLPIVLLASISNRTWLYTFAQYFDELRCVIEGMGLQILQMPSPTKSPNLLWVLWPAIDRVEKHTDTILSSRRFKEFTPYMEQGHD